MNKYILDTIHDTRKSFYNKAIVETDGTIKKLYSYSTLVAEIKGNEVFVYNLQSATTLRHVKEFLLQNEFKAETKKQILNDYIIKK